MTLVRVLCTIVGIPVILIACSLGIAAFILFGLFRTLTLIVQITVQGNEEEQLVNYYKSLKQLANDFMPWHEW